MHCILSNLACIPLLSGQPSSAVEVSQSHGLTEGKTREKSLRFLHCQWAHIYYTTLSCTQTHYLVHTDPMLHGPLIDSGCTYTSYFTSMVTLEVKAEQSSDLRVEWSSEMGAERSSDSKSRVEWSSNLCLATVSTGVSSLRFLWLFWGDSLWDLSSGSLDGRHVSPSCLHPSLIGRESLWGNPNSSFLVWQVCNWPSCEQLVSPRFR